MVFFTCNTCGASLKKNQVEKHYQNECPRCEVLSCMDCGRDFYGDEYASHTKCISEAEKYQGSAYKESASTGKGERKQQEWLEKVKQSVKGTKVNPRISRLLERVATYPNIPRKKAKFENFVRNSINVRDQQTLTELWEVFSSVNQQQSSEKSGPKEEEKAVAQDHSSKGPSVGGGEGGGPSEKVSDELPKKKRKTKQQLASSPGGTEGDSELLPGSVVNCEEQRSKKRKQEKRVNDEITERNEEQETEHSISIDDVGIPPKKKKKKKKREKDELSQSEGAGEPAVEGGREAVEQNEVSELKCNGQVGEDESQDGESSAHGKQAGGKKRKKKTKALSIGISTADDSDNVVMVGEEEGVGPVEVALKYINGGQCENRGKEERKQRKRKKRREEEEGERGGGMKAEKKSKRAQYGEAVVADGCLESGGNSKEKKSKSKKHKKHKQ